MFVRTPIFDIRTYVGTLICQILKSQENLQFMKVFPDKVSSDRAVARFKLS